MKKNTSPIKLKAFSLIELLISLIIISLIVTAFMPILTKKIKYRQLTYGGKAVSIDCTKLDSENRCMMCTKTTCTLCITQMSISEGYYVDPQVSCDYKACKDKFAGCRECNKDFCVSCLEGWGYILSTKTCLKCADNCLNCNETGCLKCAGGYTLQKGVCKRITDAPCLTAGKICIAKFNAGNPNGTRDL